MEQIPSWLMNDFAKPDFFTDGLDCINHVSTGPVGVYKSLEVKEFLIDHAVAKDYQVLVLDVEDEYEIKKFNPKLDRNLITKDMLMRILNKDSDVLYMDTVLSCLQTERENWNEIISDDNLTSTQRMLVKQNLKRVMQMIDFPKSENIYDFLNREACGRIVLDLNYNVIQLILIILTMMRNYRLRSEEYVGSIIVAEELENLQSIDEERNIPIATHLGRKRSIFLWYITHEPVEDIMTNPYWGSSAFNFDSIKEYERWLDGR